MPFKDAHKYWKKAGVSQYFRVINQISWDKVDRISKTFNKTYYMLVLSRWILERMPRIFLWKKFITNGCQITHIFKSLGPLRGIFSLLKYILALRYNVRGINQIQKLNLHLSVKYCQISIFYFIFILTK